MVVTASEGALFPTVPFNATVWPTGVQPLTTNAEIVRVTAISTDTFTITRAQESSTARSIVVGDQIAATISAKTLTDVEQANLLDGVKADTVAQTVSRGSLIYGNSTPKWDELVVGVANSVLWTNGTDVSWSAAPRLANIADTGGTARITTATSSPHLTLTGDIKGTGVLALQGSTVSVNTAIKIDNVFTTTNSWEGLYIGPTLTTATANKRLVGVYGLLIHKYSASNNAGAYGLAFALGTWPTATGLTQTDIIACSVEHQIFNQSGTASTISNLTWYETIAGSLITQISGTMTITNMYGLRIRAIARSAATLVISNADALRIEDWTGTSFTNPHLMEIGPATPYLRVMGKFTAAANATAIYISEGVTPTLRQLKTRVWDATAGHGFTNGDLVCYLT